MDFLVYTVGTITLVVLVLLAGAFLLVRAQNFFSGYRHRSRVKAALADGWEEPRLPRNWTVLGSAAMEGVVGVSSDPDPGVPVTEYLAHAASIQRKVEVAWLDGIEAEKRKVAKQS